MDTIVEAFRDYINKGQFSFNQKMKLITFLLQMQKKHVEVLKERNEYIEDLIEARKEIRRLK